MMKCNCCSKMCGGLWFVVACIALYRHIDYDWELAQNFVDFSGMNNTFTFKGKRPGERLAEEGRVKRFPVVFVPGIISSGLEVWQAQECAKDMFRRRLWGQTSMMQKFTFQSECWIEHIKLNRSTWKDQDGIKLRAASGLGAADYFITGYNIWFVFVYLFVPCTR